MPATRDLRMTLNLSDGERPRLGGDSIDAFVWFALYRTRPISKAVTSCAAVRAHGDAQARRLSDGYL